MIDYSAAKFWLEAVLVIGMVANAIYTWIVTRQGANKSEIEAVKTELRAVDQRQLIQAAKLEALPGARDFHTALQQMTKMDGEIGILSERLAGFKETMDRVERPLNLLVEAQMKGPNS